MCAPHRCLRFGWKGMPDPQRDEARAVALQVPGKDPPKTEEEEEGPIGVPPKGELPAMCRTPRDGQGKMRFCACATALPEDDVKDKDSDDISAEDKALQEGLDLAVERAQDPDPGIKRNALEHLRKEIRAATSSMTSVPKPLKFLRPHYATLKQVRAAPVPALEGVCRTIRWSPQIYTDNAAYPDESELKKLLADIMAVLAMTMGAPGARESLNYKLAGNVHDLGSWGHEFVRALAGEIGEEFTSRITSEPPRAVDDLMALVEDVVPFHIQHNAFAEAVDLLLEVQKLAKLLHLPAVDDANYQRICLYLLRCADYMADPDDLQEMLIVAFEIYKKQNNFTDALRVAIKLRDTERIGQLFGDVQDEVLKKQLAFIVGRSQINFEYPDSEEINQIVGNSKVSEHFLVLAKDLDVLEPKSPEDIYKSHLAETGGFRRGQGATQNVDSARANLASTFVNAFVNMGYGKDSLVTPEGNHWLYKNKDHGMMSAAASLGAILLWNVEEGLNQIDKFLHSGEDYIRAGALLAIGIVSTGVRLPDVDPALALLSEHLESTSAPIKYAAAFGLGLAYAGTAREDLLEVLSPVVANTDTAGITEVSLAALSLGLVRGGPQKGLILIPHVPLTTGSLVLSDLCRHYAPRGRQRHCAAPDGELRGGAGQSYVALPGAGLSSTVPRAN
jgi:26S proteasome regulatory subunit N1